MTTLLDRPRPTIKETAPPNSVLGEYRALAETIGYQPSELNTIVLNALLADHHIPVYDYDEVHQYLISLCPGWLIYSWKILRRRHSYGSDRVRNHGEYNYVPYDKPIPIHILRRAALLRSKNYDLEFFASDFNTAFGDPFLLVRNVSARAVIGAWDEPGFEGLPEVG